MLATRWSHKEAKIAGPWAGGMEPPVGLPFGEPAAQSAGEGFLPPLPDIHRCPDATGFRRFPAAPAAVRRRRRFWLVLAAFGALLLVLGVIG